MPHETPAAGGLFSFELHATDAHSAARTSTFHTPHGPVSLPAFMPVGTQGTVKGLSVEAIRATGAQMILANTYHLALRPGEEVIRLLGGLHGFCGWEGPILTDSGGFQVFSLAQNTKVTEEQATFRSHLDGNAFELSPERAVAIQEALGSDVAMVLDHVVALPNDDAAIRDATERSIRWAARCQAAQTRKDQALFAIVQGGLDPQLRVECAQRLAEMNFPGYAVGGLSVGETPAEMVRVLDVTVPAMPTDRPRYLMGVGRPQDMLEAIRRGIDLFDCVLPTRNGRNALAFTDAGPLRLRNLQYERDPRPLEPDCPCAACRHSRGYLRHLFMSGEMLGPVLVSEHNLTYYQRLLAAARKAIAAGTFVELADEKLRRWESSTSDPV
jgi:queuine tRNA-ribosyltransferase